MRSEAEKKRALEYIAGRMRAQKVGSHPVCEALIPKMAQSIFDDPFVSEAIRRQEQAPNTYRLVDAIDVIGDQKARALAVLVGQLTGKLDVLNANGQRMPKEHADACTAGVVIGMMNADPFLWQHHARKLVGETKCVFDDELVLTESWLTSPMMWWTMETAVGLSYPSMPELKDQMLEGILICAINENVFVYNIGQQGTDPHSQEHCFVHLMGAMPISKWSKVKAVDGGALEWMRMQAFLASPYIKKTELPVNRQFRKSASTPTPRVHFVDLRSIATLEHEDGSETDREYKHRWIVRGHIRSQWYPSRQEHHPIYVPPHLKGPVDAPLLKKIFRVSR